MTAADNRPAKCGTYAGWNSHIAHKEDICDECRAFKAAYQRAYRATHPETRARQRMYSRARSEAFYRLARKHPADFYDLYQQALTEQEVSHADHQD